jgi:hypothetical protein
MAVRLGRSTWSLDAVNILAQTALRLGRVVAAYVLFAAILGAVLAAEYVLWTHIPRSVTRPNGNPSFFLYRAVVWPLMTLVLAFIPMLLWVKVVSLILSEEERKRLWLFGARVEPTN